MIFNFTGDIDGLGAGIDQVSKKLNLKRSLTGTEVYLEKSMNENIEIRRKQGKIIIRYQEKVHFFRALGLLTEQLNQSNDFYIKETPQFKTNGVMVDVSRNAVLTVDSIKRLLDSMALMGLNMMMLYTEDTYEIDSLPYFGYMRGRYTHEELKECDQYADNLGIELIPCIQTLAHLTAALKWKYADDIKDTADILLVGNKKTYDFIEEMIKTTSSLFRSKRIHIGMDEAQNLGFGNYLSVNGYRRRFDIMTEHLEEVCKITRKYDLKPMMWSDMFFRLGSKTGDYYDSEAVISQDVIDNIPDEIQLVYWDYAETQEDKYKEMITKHKRISKDTIFAGGVWTWNRLNVSYDKTFLATNSALKACKEIQVDEVFVTIWANSGAETNIFSALLGLQLYAEHGYAADLDYGKLARRFRTCTGQNYEAFLDFGKMDSLPGEHVKKNRHPSNASKILLWQDVLIGLYDKHIGNRDLSSYYDEMSIVFKKHSQEAGNLSFLFDLNVQLAHVLSLKSDVGLSIKKSYDSKDIDMLSHYLRERLPNLIDEVERLRMEHRRQWFMVYKPFGWEVLDMRYGGLLARIETAMYRIKQYIDGEVNRIDELEEDRLYFDGPDRSEYAGFGYAGNYASIVSASPLA
jgi:hexosaminidase